MKSTFYRLGFAVITVVVLVAVTFFVLKQRKVQSQTGQTAGKEQASRQETSPVAAVQDDHPETSAVVDGVNDDATVDAPYEVPVIEDTPTIIPLNPDDVVAYSPVPAPQDESTVNAIAAIEATPSEWKGKYSTGVKAHRILPHPELVKNDVLRQGKTLSFQLTDELSVNAVVTSSNRSRRGTITTTAAIKGSDWGRVFLASTNDQVMGRIRIPEKNEVYAIEYDQRTQEHYVFKLDPKLADPECGNCVVHAPKANETEALKVQEAQPPIAMADEATDVSAVVDVMVVYTPDALAKAGSQTAMDNLIELGMTIANEPHDNTGTLMRLNLVHAYQEVGYNETGNISNDLNWVSSDAGVAAKRNTYGADYVVIISSTSFNGSGTAGVAYLLSNPAGIESIAFGAIDDDAWATYTTPHELGHAMGLSHAADQNFQAGPTSWSPDTYGFGGSSAGWHWHIGGNHDINGFASVLTYTNASRFNNHAGEHGRVGLFSDPNITNQGQACGDANSGYNALVLRTLRHVYAGYRTRLSGTQILVDYPNGGEFLASGNTYSLMWDSSNVTGNVKIELLKDGSFDSIIDSSALNDRTYAWVVPGGKSGTGYTIRISDAATGTIVDTSDAPFTISTTFYNEPLDTNPGYTGTVAGGWEYGAPVGNDNTTYGGAPSAYTGTNCYDTNLDGTTSSTHYLTTTAIDCSNYANVRLNFRGWFNVTSGYTVTVDVSKDGSNWTNLMSKPGLSSKVWIPYSYDISSVADASSTVYVRWGHVRGAGGGNYSGLSVDDISLTGHFIGTDPYISVNPTTLEPSCGVGSNAADQTFTVTNAGLGTLNYTVTDNQSWLSVSPTTGSSTGEANTITVSYTTSGLGVGTHNANITVTGPAASNTPVTIPVTLTVIPPLIETDVTSLTPSCEEGQNAVDQTFTVSNSGGGTLNYSIADNQTWLSVSPTSGTSIGEADLITVTYTTAGLATGSYNANITITDTAAGNSPYTVPVALTVTPAGAIYFNNFEAGPGAGWTTTGGWAHGSPTAGNASFGGPSSAYSGSNIYDTELAGYDAWSSSVLTSEAIDCTGYSNVSLQFYVWIETGADESYSFQASNNGTNWTTYESGGELHTGGWEVRNFDISTVADNQSTVYIRWNKFFAGGFIGAGLSVDDVMLTGTGADPEMDVSRGVSPVLDGSTETVSGTASGVDKALIYTIDNTGGATLTVNNATISGENNCLVVINKQPASTITIGGSDTLELTVTPGSTGGWYFDISMSNDDSNENPYDWRVSGTAGTLETMSFQQDRLPDITYAGAVDTYVNQQDASANNSLSTTLALNNKNQKLRFGLIKFDISDIPSDAYVTEASLELTEDGGSGGTADVQVYQASGIWTASANYTNDSGKVGSNLLGSAGAINSADNVVTVTLDPIVIRGWVDGSITNNGFGLKTTLSSNSSSLFLRSSDYLPTSNRPKLNVTFVSTSNNPPTANTGGPYPTAYLGGAPTAGADIYLNAGLDPDNGTNATWEDLAPVGWDPTIDTANVTFVADAGSALPGITSAYNFPGGLASGAVDALSGGCEGLGLKNLGVNTQPVTLEIWFKPDGTATTATNGQILWETGGGTGLGIFYNDGKVETALNSHVDVLSTDVSTLIGEFIQVVVTYDTGLGADNFKLYINGELRAQRTSTYNNLCGGDNSGLGERGQNNTGGAGSSDSNTESFDGKVAIFRAYHNQVLSLTEVQANYDSVAGTATVNLDGTVADVDGDPLTTTWSEVTVPAPMMFGDTTAVDTIARFDTVGSYTIRLTADDTKAQGSDETTIIVGRAYTVTYNGNGHTSGTAPDSQTKFPGNGLTLATNSGNLAKTGYTFAGWNTAADGLGTTYAEGATYSTDADLALYAKWTSTAVDLVTDVTSLNVNEGNTNTFQVKLSAAPPSGVTVSVARSGGDTDISVTGGASLTFSTSNWNTYQPVTLTAAEDITDTTNGSATITCTASGGSTDTADVAATEVDDDFTLTVNDDGRGSTTPSGSVIVDSNDDLPYDVSATPAVGKNFINWTDPSAVLTNANAAATTVKVGTTADCTITATFNTAPTVDAGPDQYLTLGEGVGGGSPVADGLYFEWDAALDMTGDTIWESEIGTFDWGFDAGIVSPDSVSDVRFDTLTKAYTFPGAMDSNHEDFDTLGSTEPATFEFIIKTDGSEGSIFETGGSGKGLQIDIVGGELRGTVQDSSPYRISYPLTAADTSRFIHVVFVADTTDGSDVAQLYVDGNLKGSTTSWPGTDWSGSDNAALGTYQNSTPTNGSKLEFNGQIALARYYRNKAFTLAEVNQNFNALSSTGPSVTTTLNGSVNDDDIGDTPTSNWTLVSTTPTGLAAPTFVDATAPVTDVTFTEEGVYTLHLTANDGHGDVLDECIIYVGKPEIKVSGGTPDTEIADGDVTPDVADDTAFGNVTLGNPVTHTFTISNTGNYIGLNLTGTPVIDITAGTDFSVSAQASTPVTAGGATTFDVTFNPITSGYQEATVTIANNDADENPYTFLVSATGESTASSVTSTYVFYNNSAWDGNDAGASVADDDAIAIDKTALLPGNTATFGNYTSYDKGINGIMIDVNGTLPSTLDEATDFEFKIGNDNSPTGWTPLTGTELPSVTVTTDGGGAGIDRITLIWLEANAPKKTWLQITVLASGNVGLASDYVFYYGNAIGEVGNSATDALVNASDALGMRANPKSIGTALMDDVYDCNRDKAVNATDVLKARSNATTTGTALQLITP